MIKPKAYGIIGGIGSGKSVVCRIFSVLGVPVFDSDSQAKKIIQEDLSVKKALILLLGKDIYSKQGVYLPGIVREKIQKNPTFLEKINAIVHPAVRKKALEFFQKNQNSPFTLYESALIHAHNKPDFIHGLIAVRTPLADRIAYLKKRNQWDDKTVDEWIKKQVPEETYLKNVDFVIDNSKNNFLIKQCLELYQKIGEISGKKD